jgi:hypothetical protein
MVPLGSVVAFIMPSFFLHEKDIDNIDTDPSVRDSAFEKLKTYVLVQNIVITVLCAPGILLIKNRPPTPPRYFYD